MPNTRISANTKGKIIFGPFEIIVSILNILMGMVKFQYFISLESELHAPRMALLITIIYGQMNTNRQMEIKVMAYKMERDCGNKVVGSPRDLSHASLKSKYLGLKISAPIFSFRS